MERTEAKKFLASFEAVAKQWCEQNGIRFIYSHGSFTEEGELRIKVNMIRTGDEVHQGVDEGTLQSGYATPNTYAWKMWSGDNEYYMVRILMARGRKYIFEWVGEEAEYGKMTAPFKYFHIKNPRTGQLITGKE